MTTVRRRAWTAALALCLATAGAAGAETAPKARFRYTILEERVDPEPQPSPSPPAAAVPLSETDTARLLQRLPPLPSAPPPPPLALRGRTPPPPRTGATVNDPFPPPAGAAPPAADAAGPLRVLRHAPEGEVEVAANVSVSFSQGMVDLAAVEALAPEAVPVRLTPQPPGRWRWVGTRTLFFEPEGGRLPMATEYAVEIPAGTRAAAGGALAEAVRWRFATPALALGETLPDEPSVGLEPLLFMAFDQRIDPAALLAALRVHIDRGSPPALRLATAAEVEADEGVRRRARAAGPGRWIAFRGTSPWPAHASVRLALPAGTASAEGPRRTAEELSWTFDTYGPLRFVTLTCERLDRACRPGAAWALEFSNVLDAEAVEPDMVTVSPPLPGLAVEVSGRVVSVRGRARARTRYTVAVSGALRDVFGQTLGEPATAQVTTAALSRQVRALTDEFVVLDPAAPPRFAVWSAGYAKLHVRARAVAPGDWPHFAGLEKPPRPEPVGRVVLDTKVAVAGGRDDLVETTIDLAAAFQAAASAAGGRQLWLDVEGVAPPGAMTSSNVEVLAYMLPQRVRVWLQSTRIGLSTLVDDGALLGWATTLADGAPLAGAALELLGTGARAVTDAHGLARLPLSAQDAFGLLARRGTDVAFLPARLQRYRSSAFWTREEPAESLRWAVFDDRSLYRPGEEVKVKGWIREEDGGRGGDLRPWGSSVDEVAYTLADASGNEVARGTAPVNAWGGFSLTLPLPSSMNLGWASLQLTAPDTSEVTRHQFSVEEFRRPEFRVTAAASQAPHFAGGTATVTARAEYFTGGGLADAPVEWIVQAEPADYRPPHRDGFHFGRPYRWRRWEGDEADATRELTTRTDGQGRARLALDFTGADLPLARSVMVGATVADVNRQQWSAGGTLLVHPADVYVGLRLPRFFAEAGARFTVDAIATDLDGTAVAGRPVEVVVERLTDRRRHGKWIHEAEETGRCALTSGADVVQCTVAPAVGGAYRIRATVRDAAGRASLSEADFWVGGGAQAARGVEQDEVTLVLDRESYRAGETAEVLVLSPIVPAEGLLTVNRSGLVHSESFHVGASAVTLRVPIDASLVPGAQVRVDVVGTASRADAPGRVRPAFAGGTAALRVPPVDRTLTVAVAPGASTLAPGGTTTLDVELKDAAGRPVAEGEVALAVVDEAVLALARPDPPDPVAAFYPDRSPGVGTQDLRAVVALDAAPLTAEQLDRFQSELGYAVSSMASSVSRETVTVASESLPGTFDDAPVRLRRAFSPLALFVASAVTGPDGRVQVPLTVPDSLTRYRVVALAATRGTQFGAGESSLTVRLPLMARPSPPRFLSFGDRFLLPVVVQNQSDQARAVDVAVRAQGLALTAGAGRRVEVPAHGRVEVPFPMAVVEVGTARVQVAAAGGGEADAAEMALPVLTPATTEAFAVYGTLDHGALVQPVRPPSDALPQFGGLEVTTSSTALQSLTDALLYLVSYPFECSEQLSSRVLGIATLRDVLSAFHAQGLPGPAELEAVVARDLGRLRAMQNSDGGFGFWRRGEPSWPYTSIHVALALERARSKGFAVPGGMLDDARGYLASIEKRIPKEYPLSARHVLVAYALHVRHRMGDADPARARALVREAGAENLSFEALGWLLPVVGQDPGSRAEADAIRLRLANSVAETAGAAHVAVSYGEEGPHLLLSSDRRADAVVLEALIADQPQSDLIPKLVEGLLGHRRAGHWLNTQENAFVLLALDRYFQAYEKATPDFVARAWLGGRPVAEQEFRGRGTERHAVTVPMEALAAGGRRDLVLAKEGAGRLYYRLGLSYAPRALRLDALDAGFTVTRRYEAVDDPGDVRRDALGTWHVRAGAHVRVRLSLAATGRRVHVALVDPLPAGLEAQNPALAATRIPADESGDEVEWWRRTWFDHQNLRDDRVEAFTSELEAGVYAYSYVTLATTPGTFVVAPAKAEEMYQPETFGRSGTDRLVVE